MVKKVLRGTLAGLAFAACVGFGATATTAMATAVESDQAEEPSVSALLDFNLTLLDLGGLNLNL